MSGEVRDLDNWSQRQRASYPHTDCPEPYIRFMIGFFPLNHLGQPICVVTYETTDEYE